MTVLGRGDLSPPRRRHRRRRWPWVLLVLVVLGAGGYVGWRWWHSRNTTSTVAMKPCVAPTPSTAPAAVGAVRLRVLNGTKRAGLAHDVAKQLHRRGLRIQGVGNSRSTPSTTIVVAPGDLAQALTVAEQLHGPAVVVHQQKGSRLTLVIGRSWPGVGTPAEARAKRKRDEAQAHSPPRACATPLPSPSS